MSKLNFVLRALPAALISASVLAAPTWVEGGTYTAGTVVYYNGHNYQATVTQTDYVGTGWNPTVGSLWTDLGAASGSSPSPAPAPAPTPSPAPAPTPAPSSCNATTWSAGVNYGVGTTVRYAPNGNYYKEVNGGSNGSDGTDPTISTWYWQPTTCGGSSSPAPAPTPAPTPAPAPAPTCSASTWSAGVNYPVGTTVRYAPNGNYYKEVNAGSNGSDGTDPTISTWYWQPTSCGGSAPTPTPSGSGFVVSEAQFNQMFPSRNSFYSYAGLTTAMGAYPAFAKTGSSTIQLQEAAAFLANVDQETGALVYIREINTANWPLYCSSGNCGGKQYYGRGPMQLSWDFNYSAAGAALGIDLLNNPDLVATDSAIAWKTALWYWMTQRGQTSQTPHDAMVNSAGFGETTRAINGGIECNQGAGSLGYQEMNNRATFYANFAGMLGVSPGSHLTC